MMLKLGSRILLHSNNRKNASSMIYSGPAIISHPPYRYSGNKEVLARSEFLAEALGKESNKKWLSERLNVKDLPIEQWFKKIYGNYMWSGFVDIDKQCFTQGFEPGSIEDVMRGLWNISLENKERRPTNVSGWRILARFQTDPWMTEQVNHLNDQIFPSNHVFAEDILESHQDFIKYIRKKILWDYYCYNLRLNEMHKYDERPEADSTNETRLIVQSEALWNVNHRKLERWQGTKVSLQIINAFFIL